MKKLIEWHADNREITNRTLKAYAVDCRFILEIGQGTSTEILAEAIASKAGRVWSMDLKAAKKSEFITSIEGDSLLLPWTRCIDLLYLDGCHKPYHVRQELEKFARFVNPGGYILFDDARNYEYPRLDHVIDEFATRHSLGWYYATPEPGAIAVIEVPRRLGQLPITRFRSATDCPCEEP